MQADKRGYPSPHSRINKGKLGEWKTSMNNIPEETRWLLSFVNIGKTTGKLAPPLSSIPKWKRKPGITDADGALVPLSDSFVSDGKWVWEKTTGECRGRAPWYLYLNHRDRVKTFAEVMGDKIKLPVTGLTFTLGDAVANLSGELLKLVFDSLETTRAMVWVILYAYIVEDKNLLPASRFLNDKFYRPIMNIQADGKMTFGHDGVFPQILAAHLLDFMENQKELHQQFKVCTGCGRFWIAEKKSGRPQIFCAPECEDAFNRLPKEEQAKRVREYRAYNKKMTQKKEFRELTELIKEWESLLEAETKARDWIYTQGKTLKQYRNYYGV